MTPRPTTRALTAVVVAALVAMLTGCASREVDQQEGQQVRQQQHPLPATVDAAPTTPTASSVDVTKVIVFVVENHSLEQMRSGMPWLSQLADRYGYATQYDAITHPSLPNYLAIAGGSTFGVTDDLPPSLHPLTQPSVFGQAVRARRSVTTYAEGMTSNCELTNEGRYAVRHNPWTYFSSERAMCQQHDVPLTRLSGDVGAGTLPQIGLVVPDVCNDAHDCALSQADAWLEREVGLVMGGPDFTSGHLAVVITADEDDRDHGNRVLTVVAHPALHHQVVSAPLSHYALSRSLAAVAGVAPLHNARRSVSLLAQFGLR